MRSHLVDLHSMLDLRAATDAPPAPRDHEERMAWWREARFGMFIHWGLYAIPAGEWNGSTGYGEEFANLLFNNYPGQDYQDVMDGVDHLLKEGLVDEDRLYVTGGSAGGIMTAWMIGKNNRFRAAVVAKV